MLPKFDLYMPEDFVEACALKADGAKPVAGGTDVFVNMHGGKDKSARVLDIKRLKELQGQRFSESGLDLGALTTHREIEVWDEIRSRYYAMFQGCSQVGSVQIRHRATLGGNIMNGAPSADSIGPLLVHDAVVTVAGPDGEREIPLDKFYTGFKKFDIQPDELLTRLHVPLPPDNAGSAYYKYMRRNAMDLALMGVSAYVEIEDQHFTSVRIALTTSGPTPMRSYSAEQVLLGQPVSDEIIVQAAETVEREGKPRSSWRSSAEFRTRLLHDITIIVLHEAVQRALKPVALKAEAIPMRQYPGLDGLKPRPKMEDVSCSM
ncbi:MAG: FAD binding domain-containing protein [Lachnospiraceae bacterium]|nr:FAD binding domain-containing protein [Lachnospiraceae bacterium]